MTKIYVNHPGKKFKSVADLIEWGYNTQKPSTGCFSYAFVRTYSNVECTILQCHMARRSFEDLLDIAQTYFPNTGKKKLAKVIYKLNETKRVTFYPFICRDINKLVFPCNKSNNFSEAFLRTSNNHNTGNPNYKGKGKYCFNDILKLLGQPLIKTTLLSSQPY